MKRQLIMYAGEIGTTGAAASLAVLAMYAAAEALIPGLGAAAIRIEAVMVALAASVAMSLLSSERPRSPLRLGIFFILALAVAAAAAWAAYAAFVFFPDAQPYLAAASALAVLLLAAALA